MFVPYVVILSDRRESKNLHTEGYAVGQIKEKILRLRALPSAQDDITGGFVSFAVLVDWEVSERKQLTSYVILSDRRESKNLHTERYAVGQIKEKILRLADAPSG